MPPHPYRVPLARSFRFIHEPVSNGDPAAGPTFFVGRQRDLDNLCTRLLFSEGGAFLVTGYHGLGKTSFVNRVVNQLGTELSRSRHSIGPTELIDVQINLARSVTTAELMHYIIRSLRQRLKESGAFAKLDADGDGLQVRDPGSQPRSIFRAERQAHQPIDARSGLPSLRREDGGV